MDGFKKAVFINCPFDADYHPLLKTLLFTIKALGFNPRITLERSDSGEVRLSKIKELLEKSGYSIHDLSRSRAKAIGEYFRQNMPFELGIDLGCRDYHQDQVYRTKKILILEEEKYSTQKALSDLSFADCKCHNGDAETLVFMIRNWFAENGARGLDSPSKIWDDYNFFNATLYKNLIEKKFSEKAIAELPMKEFMDYIDEHFKPASD